MTGTSSYIQHCLQTILFVLAATVLKTTTATLRNDIHILLYDENNNPSTTTTSVEFFKDRSTIANIHTTIYGGKLQNGHGFGAKLKLVKPLLEVANSNELIIIADARHVILNVPENEKNAIDAVDYFLNTFHRITKHNPHAIVMSVEEQCCVAAMSYSRPGDYFDSVTGKRKHRACSSGKSKDCLRQEKDNDNIASWKEFSRERAFEQQTSTNNANLNFDDGYEEYDRVYLNSGIIAGYRDDLLILLNISDIDSTEDDQAVLTDLMYTFPEMIMLDYQQEIFGNNQVQKGLEDGCIFEHQGIDKPLIHSTQLTQPLILHTPGKFYGCLDTLIEELGGESQQRYLQQEVDDDEEDNEEEEKEATVFDLISNFVDANSLNPLSNYGISVGSYGLFDSYGYFDNYGYYDQYGRFDNYGFFDNYGYYDQYGRFDNYGYYNQYGYFNPRDATTVAPSSFGSSASSSFGTSASSSFGTSASSSLASDDNDTQGRTSFATTAAPTSSPSSIVTSSLTEDDETNMAAYKHWFLSWFN